MRPKLIRPAFRRKRNIAALVTLSLLVASSGCTNSQKDSPKPSTPSYALIENLAGTATSSDSASSLSFNVPLAGLEGPEAEKHLAGDFLFGRTFVAETGLGPAFNASSCIACHARDGRGALPIIPPGMAKVKLGANEALLLRISLGEGASARNVPGFTEQVFHRGVYDLRTDTPGSGQADIEMSFKLSQFQYADGRKVELRIPQFTLINAYDSIGQTKSALDDPDLRVSPRIGPPMIGLGLLEAIDERDILALADPNDSNGDGISGRPNFIDGKLGRFGWKANTSSLRLQVAGALANDMGLRTSIHPDESISGTGLFLNFIERLSGTWKPPAIEISDAELEALEFYSATLSVPKRRNVRDEAVLNGAHHFESMNCVACHTPQFRTSSSLGVSPALRGLTIYPFSDGLLHDMGDELADRRDDHAASGREWKTRPLWGIGMTHTINPRAGFLHDGRARTLEEAILFHGGEAARSRQAFANAPSANREELLAFLKSL